MPSAPPSMKRIIQAGAGAGKTTELVATFIDFCQSFKKSQQRYPRVAICTFTRKATFELQERLQQKCLEIEDHNLLEHLTKKSDVHISTIHGVCSLFLQKYGSTLGFDPQLNIVSDEEKKREWRKLVRHHLKKNPDFLDLLQDYRMKDLVGIAQKHTRNLLVQPQLRAWSSEDFQVWITEELKSSVQKALTFYQDLGEFQLRPPWEKFRQALSEWKQISALSHQPDLISACRSFFERTHKRPSHLKEKDPFPIEWIESFVDWWDYFPKWIESSLFQPSFLESWEKRHRLLQSFLGEIAQDSLRENIQSSRLTFSELEEYSWYLATHFPQTAEDFSLQWDLWMIDEYQDTSPIQENILQKFIRKTSEFVVGDPQQSIYLFRQADSSLFGKKIAEFQKQGGEFKQKTVNYRSHQELVHFFNDTFCLNDTQFMTTLADPEKPLKYHEEQSAVEILINSPEDDEGGVQSLVIKIEQLLSHGAKLSDIAILSRTGDLLKQTGFALSRLGFPVQIHSQVDFFERREVMEILCFLRFLMNPHDNTNFVTLLRTPWIGTDDATLLDFIQSKWTQSQVTVPSLWLKLKHQQQESTSSALRECYDRLEEYRIISKEHGLSNTLLQLFHRTPLMRMTEYFDDSGQIEANIFKLLDILEQFERSGSHHIHELIDRLLHAHDADPENSDATPLLSSERINLMTIHSSKGLQFPHVVVVGLHKKNNEPKRQDYMADLQKGFFATSLALFSEKKVYAPFCEDLIREQKYKENLEQKRVFYVAVTRAQQSLTLCWKEDSKFKGLNRFLGHLNLATGEHQGPGYTYRVTRQTTGDQNSSQYRKFGTTSQQKEKTEFFVHPLTLPGFEKKETINVTQLSSEKSSAKSIQDLKSLKSKARFGVRVHRLLEGLKSLEAIKDPRATTKTILSEFERNKFVDLKPIEKSYFEFLLELKELPFLKILEAGHTEWGFQTLLNEKNLRGQIDLWSEYDGKLWIIDYKTGSSNQFEKARIQLLTYRDALLSIYPQMKKLPVECVALFLQERLILKAES